MYKLVVLFSLAVMVTAKTSAVAPLTYISVIPGFSSLSQYSSSVIHGSPPVRSDSGVYSPQAHNFIAAMRQIPQELMDSQENAVHSVQYARNRFIPHHQLQKRSIGVPTVVFSTVLSPVSYTNPYSVYPERAVSHHATRLVASTSASAATSPLGFSSASASILGAHPYWTMDNIDLFKWKYMRKYRIA